MGKEGTKKRNVVQDDPYASEGHMEYVYWKVMGNEVGQTEQSSPH